MLPAAWRRNGALLFWWTLLQQWQREPWLMSAACLAVPVWLGWAVLLGLRYLQAR